MAKNKSLNDPVFGELTKTAPDLWERPIEIEFLGQTWKVALAVMMNEEKGAEDKQIQAFELFQKDTSRLMKQAEKSLLSYYQSVCEDYRDQSGITDPHDEDVPIVSSSDELAKLIELESVLFPYVRPAPTFGLVANCTWEPEHGVAVKFVDGDVEEVGFQDIII